MEVLNEIMSIADDVLSVLLLIFLVFGIIGTIQLMFYKHKKVSGKEGVQKEVYGDYSRILKSTTAFYRYLCTFTSERNMDIQEIKKSYWQSIIETSYNGKLVLFKTQNCTKSHVSDLLSSDEVIDNIINADFVNSEIKSDLTEREKKIALAGMRAGAKKLREYIDITFC